MLRERLEGGVVLERRPELAAEGVEGRIAARLERRPQRVEDRPQDLPDAGVIDELSLAQRGDARALLVEEALRRACREARDRGRVDVQRLEEQARGRRIGRDLAAVGAEKGMDRAEAEIGGAERAGVRGRLAGIRIGADAEVLARAKGVELGREAPAAAHRRRRRAAPSILPAPR